MSYKRKPGKSLGGTATDRGFSTATGKGSKTGVGGTWNNKGQSRGLGGTRKPITPPHLQDAADKNAGGAGNGKRSSAVADVDYD